LARVNAFYGVFYGPRKRRPFTSPGIDRDGRTIFVADAHRGDGKRFLVRADEKLTAFVELEAAIRRGA